MAEPVILVVDDDKGIPNSIRRIFHRKAYQFVTVLNGKRALELCREEPFDLVISDLRMPEMGGLEFVQALRAEGINAPVIMMTGYGSIQSAVEAIKAGANEYITKPINRTELREMVDKLLGTASLSEVSDVQEEPKRFERIVGRSQAMQEVFRRIEAIAATESTVLLQGETGTGKELVARAIHDNSRRAGKPFIAVNCSAINAGVFESELFGHVKGAFTGAITDKAGVFKLADKGTVFLDEIGDMPLELQQKMLRVLQERELKPVGRDDTVKVDIRLIAATNKNLENAVMQGRFREDLFYRLHVIPISLPPLRERQGDVELLARFFLKESLPSRREGIKFSEAALNEMVSYHWPGNVRELKNAVEHAVVLAKGDTIEPEDLPVNVTKKSAAKDKQEIGESSKTLDMIEKEAIERVLLATHGNKRKAAGLLGISRATFYRKMVKYGLIADE